jgi:hypothetical protein
MLQTHFGKKFGETLHTMARGLDDKKLNYEQVRKSVSVDVNYGIRFNDDEEVKSFLKQVAAELSKRLCEIDKKGKCITIKVMMRAKGASEISKKFLGHGVADSKSKSMQLNAFTNDSSVIFKNSLNLLAALNIPAHELRGIGIQVSKLDEETNKQHLGGGKIMEMFKKMSENQDLNKPSTSRVKLEPLPKASLSPPKKKSRLLKKTLSGNNLSVADMFAVKKPPSHLSRMKNIDPDVLNELPADIVEEILRDYDMMEMNSIKEEDEVLPLSSTSASNEQNLFEVKMKENAIVENTDENIFLKDNWRALLRAWIFENDYPAGTLVENLHENLEQLIRIKNLETPYIAMRFLHRIIGERNVESWKNYYCDILYTSVQKAMDKVYGKDLQAPYAFK